MLKKSWWSIPLILLVSCNLKSFVARHMAGSIEDMNASFMEEPSLREAREAAPAMLKMLDGFIKSAPDDKDLLAAGAHLNCGFGILLIEGEDNDWASILYKKGMDYAIRGLNQDHRGIDQLIKQGKLDRIKAILAHADRDELPLIFWAGECMAAWVNLNLDNPDAISDLPIALAFIRRAMEIDDTYFYGGAHMALGMYYGSMSKAMGGNPEKSKSEFEKVFEITKNKFMLAKVFFAKTYCVQTQNRRLFEKTLHEVLDFDPETEPSIRLVNLASKKKAEALLDEVDDKFIQ